MHAFHNGTHTLWEAHASDFCPPWLGTCRISTLERSARVGMALGWEIVGRGPKPRFHRTMRPLPKAKPTGGSNGDAFTRSDLTL